MAVNPQIKPNGPADLPPEAVKDPILAALLAGGNTQQYQSPNDPPVYFSGYWEFGGSGSSPEGTPSTFNRQFVNKPGTKPFSAAEADFYNLDRGSELQRFQELAFQAGLYGPNAEREDIRWGAYDEQTFSIWSDLNKSAAVALKAGKKHSVWDRLQDLVDHRPDNLGKKAKKRQPLVTKLPDPREIEEMVRGVAPGVIGRDPTDSQISEFTSMYRALVQNFQQQVYDLEDTEKGGTVDAPPDAAALAAFQLRTQNPEQYEEAQSVGRQAAYLKLLKGAL